MVMDAGVHWHSQSGWSVRLSVDNLNDAGITPRRRYPAQHSAGRWPVRPADRGLQWVGLN